MTTDVKQVVSMLAGEQKITLFTMTGEVLDLKNDGPHDTAKISEFLAPKLTGTGAVEINLRDYLTITQVLGDTPEYEEEGVIKVVMIDGKEVKGIFYPEKVKVTVQHKGEDVEIPSPEKLMKHMKRAHDENSPAVRNFLRRMAKVAKDRRHSAEDLMDFIEKSNLPLTNDGRIIAYKRVKLSSKAGYYVDCHSGSVEQRVGTRVWMDVDAVDPNRNQSCSHGLHVGNLQYMGGFHRGNPTLITVVDPEDFIAVPHRETTKCRVCAYDIVGIMTGSQSDKIDSGTHVEGDGSFDALIAGIIEGRYQKPFEAVQVGSKKMLGKKSLTEEDAVRDLETAEEVSVDTVAASGKALEEDVADNKRDVVGAVKKAKAEQKGKDIWDDAPAEVIAVFEALHKGETSKAQIARDNNTSTRTMQRWQEKYDFDGWVAKKTAPAKVYDVYYDGKVMINMIKAHRTIFHTGLKEAKEAVEGKGLVFEGISEADLKVLTDLVGDCGLVIVEHGSTPPEQNQEETKAETPAPAAPAKKLGVREQGQALYAAWQNAGEDDGEPFALLVNFKKAKKKGWEALGFNKVQVKKIERAIKKTA